MTTQEAERMFRGAIQAAVDNARANGVKGDIIAHDLRSIARDVSKQWNAEMDRRNAEHIAQMNARAAAE
jgi:hypothetical protein